MAGISRSRWRKAWLDGVVVGATGRGQCQLTAPKLIATFQRGVAFGKTNVDSVYVRTALAQKKPPKPIRPPAPPKRSFRSTRYGPMR